MSAYETYYRFDVVRPIRVRAKSKILFRAVPGQGGHCVKVAHLETVDYAGEDLQQLCASNFLISPVETEHEHFRVWLTENVFDDRLPI